MIVTVINFECCGSTIKTSGKGTGLHTGYCLSCNTGQPDYNVEYEEV